jgi:hypothetical protein
MNDNLIASNAIPTSKREMRITKANTDLLFKLFDNIEQRDKKRLQLKSNKPFYRSNLINSNTSSNNNLLSKALIKGEDPCIINAVSEDLFPLLRLNDSTRFNETVIAFNTKMNESSLISMTSNGLSNSTPILTATAATSFSSTNIPILNFNDQNNYSQELSEVVAAL